MSPRDSRTGRRNIMSGTKQMNEIKIDYRPVLKNLGYDPPENSPVRIRSLIEVYMEKALRWITPTYNYVLKDVKGVLTKDESRNQNHSLQFNPSVQLHFSSLVPN